MPVFAFSSNTADLNEAASDFIETSNEAKTLWLPASPLQNTSVNNFVVIWFN